MNFHTHGPCEGSIDYQRLGLLCVGILAPCHQPHQHQVILMISPWIGGMSPGDIEWRTLNSCPFRLEGDFC